MRDLWPKLDDPKAAREAALEGAGTALFITAVTAVCATLSIIYGKPILGIDRMALADAAVFAIVSWRIGKMSRSWAVLGLFLYFLEVAVKIVGVQGHLGSSDNGRYIVILFLSIFILKFVNAVRGTFAFHRLTVRCSKCAGENVSNSSFCTGCGASLESEKAILAQ